MNPDTELHVTYDDVVWFRESYRRAPSGERSSRWRALRKAVALRLDIEVRLGIVRPPSPRERVSL